MNLKKGKKEKEDLHRLHKSLRVALHTDNLEDQRPSRFKNEFKPHLRGLPLFEVLHRRTILSTLLDPLLIRTSQ
jgi:hypothetical protein